MSFKSLYASYLLSLRMDPDKCGRMIDELAIARSSILDYVYPNNIKIATAQVRLTGFRDMKTFIRECSRLLEIAVQNGCHLFLLPHLMGLTPISTNKTAFELARRFVSDWMGGTLETDDLYKRFTHLTERFADFLFDCYYNVFTMFAHKYNIYIAAGSTYVSTTRGVFCRSYLFGPDRRDALFQDKINLTEFERKMGIQAGNTLEIMNLKIGKVAILADCDGSFPECYKAARTLGAQIVLNPCLTAAEPLSGEIAYNPCRLNAQHYGIYTVRSSFFSAEGDPFGKFRGQSGIYSPLLASGGLDGVIAHLDKAEDSGVISARIDPPALRDTVDVYVDSVSPRFCEILTAETYPRYLNALSER